MITLNFKTSAFHRGTTFRVAVADEHTVVCYLANEGGKVWILQESFCSKNKYLEACVAEPPHLHHMVLIRNGDTVTVDGQQYKVQVQGDHSTVSVGCLVESESEQRRPQVGLLKTVYLHLRRIGVESNLLRESVPKLFSNHLEYEL